MIVAKNIDYYEFKIFIYSEVELFFKKKLENEYYFNISNGQPLIVLKEFGVL